MVHFFSLLDIPLLASLEQRGTALCNELLLTRGLHPLRLALTSCLPWRARQVCTCVTAQPAGPAGFAQMLPRPASGNGIILYIAPALSWRDTAPVWCELLEAIAATAGELGLQQLAAEAPAGGPEIDALRQAGFAIYVRQDILCLNKLDAQKLPADSLLLRPATAKDTWAIQQLFGNTAPRLAQLAGVGPHREPAGAVHSYVLPEAGELAAYLEIRCGPLGAWFNALIHPQAEACASQVLRHGLAILGKAWNRPVYCCVRRYQDWLTQPLTALGFEPFASSVALVKRLVAPLAEPELARAPALEAHPVKATLGAQISSNE